MRGGFLSLPDIDKHNRNRRDKQHLASRKGEPAPLQASVLALRWRYPLFDGPAASVMTRPRNKSTSWSSRQAADFLRGAARLTLERTTRDSHSYRPCS